MTDNPKDTSESAPDEAPQTPPAAPSAEPGKGAAPTAEWDGRAALFNRLGRLTDGE